MIPSQLPFDWKKLRLKDVSSGLPNAIVDGPFGSNLKTDDYVESGVPVLQGKNITKDTFRWFDVRFISNKKAEELKRSSVRPGDILLVKIGSIGYSAIVNSLNGFEFAIIPANLVKITLNPEIICTRYLHRWLTSPEAKRYLISNASKTAQPALSLGKIKELPVPCPPLSEQRRIAAILDKADALREKRREALAKLDDLAQSIFIEIFGNLVTNPKNWKRGTIGDALKDGWLLELQDGNHGERHPKVSDFKSDGLPFVMANCLVDGRLNIEKAYKLDESWLRKLRIGFSKPNDVLLSHKGTIGQLAIVPKNCKLAILSPQATYYRPSEKLNSRFLMGFFSTKWFQTLLEKEAIQSTRAYIGITRQKTLPMIFPPIELQNQFALKIEHIDELRKKGLEELNMLENLFSALQSRSFRGELSKTTNEHLNQHTAETVYT